MRAYLKLTTSGTDTVEGESRDQDHEREIVLHDIQWQAEQEVSPLGSGRRTTGRRDISPVSIRKPYDASSPYLAKAVLSGQIFENAVITLRKTSGPKPLDYLVITLTNVMLTGYDVRGPVLEDGVDQVMEDEVEMTFATIMVEYTEEKQDHSAGEKHTFGFDSVKNMVTP